MAINPITYKQILENVNRIETLARNVGDIDIPSLQDAINQLNDVVVDANESIDKIADSITNLDTAITDTKNEVAELETKVESVVTPPDTGDITNTDDGIKVIGIHTNTSNLNTNTSPASYMQGVTYEIKSVTPIGLKGKDGVVTDFCFVITLIQDAPLEGETAGIQIRPMQIAYGNSGLYQYFRYGQVNDTWSAWESAPEIEIRPQYVTSDAQPTTQLENEYWCETLL